MAKIGERVWMDIEVSGTPQPLVTFYKDDKPIGEAIISKHNITTNGNSYTLIIEKGLLNVRATNCVWRLECHFSFSFRIVCRQDAGKYMVKAVNDAGETQSIADFIVLEPTPEPTIDIMKTVAVENIEGQRVCIFRLEFTHINSENYFKCQFRIV